jgi:Fur family ferric uptake transcriptional regulator
MSTHKPDIKEILRQSGNSITKPRLLIFDLLVGQEPMTMYQLYDKTKNQLDRASIYRIVDLFEKLGVIQRISSGWGYKIELSDKFAEHHHHLTCLSCHRVTPIAGEEMEAFVTSLSKQHSFRAIGHQVEIQGYCNDCEATASSSVRV